MKTYTFVKINKKYYPIKFGFNARTDRGAVELNHYAFIPLEQFKKVSKSLYTED